MTCRPRTWSSCRRGGAFAQLLAIDHPERVLALVLISTSTATGGQRELPPPTEEFMSFAANATVDWSDPASLVEYQVGYSRVLASGQRSFDEASIRELLGREIARARDIVALQNHEIIAGEGQSSKALSSITAPTLVIHGTADPMFPVEHGQALADEIPGADLLTLEGAGHGVYPADFEMIAAAIASHTSSPTGTAGRGRVLRRELLYPAELSGPDWRLRLWTGVCGIPCVDSVKVPALSAALARRTISTFSCEIA